LDCPHGVDEEEGDKVEGKGKRSLKGNMISQELVHSILARYTLPPEGIHGVPHWARVLENGRRLLKVTGAKRDVVELFAVFHDSQRINEGIDDGHGRRGAELARELRGVEYELTDGDFDLLIQTCNLHTEGYVDGDITVRTCWDADRLDLERVGITPRSDKLCTDGARDPDFLNWAIERSEKLFVPPLVSEEWGVRLQ
jgi:uncharacterized protein